MQQATQELKEGAAVTQAERDKRIAAEAEVRALTEKVRLSARQADMLDERLQVGSGSLLWGSYLFLLSRLLLMVGNIVPSPLPQAHSTENEFLRLRAQGLVHSIEAFTAEIARGVLTLKAQAAEVAAQPSLDAPPPSQAGAGGVRLFSDPPGAGSGDMAPPSGAWMPTQAAAIEAGRMSVPPTGGRLQRVSFATDTEQMDPAPPHPAYTARVTGGLLPAHLRPMVGGVFMETQAADVPLISSGDQHAVNPPPAITAGVTTLCSGAFGSNLQFSEGQGEAVTQQLCKGAQTQQAAADSLERDGLTREEGMGMALKRGSVTTLTCGTENPESVPAQKLLLDESLAQRQLLRVLGWPQRG